VRVIDGKHEKEGFRLARLRIVRLILARLMLARLRNYEIGNKREQLKETKKINTGKPEPALVSLPSRLPMRAALR
jgi:hypothetical protein